MSTSRRFLQYLFVGCLLVGAPLMVGCDSGGDDDDDNGGPGGGLGTFTAAISGEGVDQDLSGNAWFWSGQDPDTGEQAFWIWLMPEDEVQGSSGIWFATMNTRPGTGTYQFLNFEDGDLEEAVNNQFVGWIAGSSNYFASTGGTLTITNSSSSRVQGSFSVSALGYSMTNPDGDLTATITGTFSAVGFSGPFPTF